MLSTDSRRTRSTLGPPAAALVLVLAACGEGGESAAEGLRQTSFRVRADAGTALNHDGGWAAGEGQPAEVRADEPFRIRFELEADARRQSGASEGFRLQARRNDGPWQDLLARDFPYPDEISSPGASIVEAAAYADGTATEDLLGGSTRRFDPGVGVSLDSVAPPWAGALAQGEWEWPLVIRRFADGAVTNDEGDLFEFRMRTVGGAPIPPGSTPARVALAVPPGLLGGTFVETPGRLGPWQASDGALYFVMEPAETDNVLMMVKSTDGGATWAEVDGARRPATGDLEGVATAWHDGRIHILHQITESVVYHVFGTSDAAEGEGWLVRDEFVAAPGEPPVQVAALEVRTDGSGFAVYGGPRDLYVRVRSPGGEWGDETPIPAPDGEWLSGPQSVLLPDGRVTLAYTESVGSGGGGTGEGRVWLRRLDADGIPGPGILVSRRVGAREDESGALAPLIHLPETDEVLLLFRTSEGHLWERRHRADGTLSNPVQVTTRRVVQNAVDSDQVGADAIAHEGVVHLLFIDEATRALHHARRLPSGEWSSDEVLVEGIDGQWVRGRPVRDPTGAMVYGFVYDAGSDGGSGMNRYGSLTLTPPEGVAGPGG